MFLCPLLAGAIAAAGKKSIVDYFSEIDHPLLWQSLDGPVGDADPVAKADVVHNSLKTGQLTIDIPNYYMEISDKGPQGGDHRQYALFSPEKPVFAIARKYIGAYRERNFIAFLTQRQNKWIDITHEIFPKIDAAFFLDGSASVPQCAELRFILPRQGTTIKAEFRIDEFCWLESDGTKESLKAAIRHVKYKSVEIHWIKNQGKFQPGKKVPN